MCVRVCVWKNTLEIVNNGCLLKLWRWLWFLCEPEWSSELLPLVPAEWKSELKLDGEKEVCLENLQRKVWLKIRTIMQKYIHWCKGQNENGQASCYCWFIIYIIYQIKRSCKSWHPHMAFKNRFLDLKFFSKRNHTCYYYVFSLLNFAHFGWFQQG